jgi:hypothetical protein
MRKPSISTLAAQEKSRKAIHGMYQLLAPVGQESTESVNYKSLAAAIGVEPYLLQRIITLLAKKGALVRRYRGHVGQPSAGKSSYWTLTVPEEEAVKIMISDWKNLYQPTPKPKETPAKEIAADAVVVADERSPEEVRAIAGPENKNEPFEVLRHLRRDESAAQVEAVRQYIDRAAFLDQKLDELAKAGITVNRAAIVFERDERLETLALLLPYINNLEGRITVMQETIESLQKKASVSTELAQENRKLKEQNQRLISEKVGRSIVSASA